MIYFALIRPQQQAKKKADETVRGAKTGDKIVTGSGIHGVITNVKDTTVILKIADNVKIEIEKSSIDKITRPDGTTPARRKSRRRQGLTSSQRTNFQQEDMKTGKHEISGDVR